jgi:4-amino-4-deoxy-L-arabinose transferase-like glycosyltransferase
LLFGLVLLAALRLWILPVGSSLWLDETVTYWSAYKGIGAAIARCQFWPGQNLLYTIIAAIAIRIGGPSEVALRLPSLIATLLTAWLLFQLGKRLFDRETAILAVLVFTSLQPIAKDGAVNARPYAIGLLLVVASTLELVWWLRFGRLRTMLAFAVLSAGIPYFHILFAVMYLVFIGYAVYMKWSGERLVSWTKLMTAGVLILLLICPLLWNCFHAKCVSAEASWASTPDTAELLSSFMPPLLGASLLGGLLVSLLVCGRCDAIVGGTSPSTRLLLVSWLTIPILVLYLIARLTVFKTFVPRYFLTALPALALLVGWIVRSLEPARARIIVAIAIAVGSIVSFGGRHLNLSVFPHREDWRTATALVRAAGISESTPVLIRVGLIETAKLRWDLNIDRDSPLLCPLSRYPIPGHIVLLPYRLNPEAVNYLQDVSLRILRPVDTFVLIARTDDNTMILWLRGWLWSQGFAASEMGKPEGISILLFHRRVEYRRLENLKSFDEPDQLP